MRRNTLIDLFRPTPTLRRHEWWLGEQIGEPQQRVTADRECRDEPDLRLAVDLHLAQRSAVFAPAEALLDPLADPLAGQVSGVACGPGIDRRATWSVMFMATCGVTPRSRQSATNCSVS